MSEAKHVGSWRAGAVVQGIALGLLLVPALIALLTLATNAQVFRYQGF